MLVRMIIGERKDTKLNMHSHAMYSPLRKWMFSFSLQTSHTHAEATLWIKKTANDLSNMRILSIGDRIESVG